MSKPDFFFIVGAPKCGTTAMTDYLRQHPDVGLVLKEPHYFGSDLAVKRRVETEREYLDLYRHNDHAMLVGDASVFYLHSLRAAEEIKAFAPGAAIVAMLRNPVDMLHSLHSQLVFIDSEDITDFEPALQADSDRLSGRRLPQHRVLSQSGYRNIARYSSQLRRYFDTFGRERVHTVIFDDFAADPGDCYARLCDFLGLDSAFRPTVRAVNPNKRARSKIIRRVVEHPSPMMRRVVHTLPTQAIRRGLSATVKRANTRYQPREPMASELRQRLNTEYAGEVEALSELLGRDLTGWSRSR